MSKPYRDLREWLQGVEALGELKKIDGADWKLEMGAITELLGQEGQYPPPAILFDSIPGFPKGFRTLFGTTGSVQRMAITLGLSDVRSARIWSGPTARNPSMLKPIPPKEVNTGPIFENIQSGKDIDLLKFPIPFMHEKDGGDTLDQLFGHYSTSGRRMGEPGNLPHHGARQGSYLLLHLTG